MCDAGPLRPLLSKPPKADRANGVAEFYATLCADKFMLVRPGAVYPSHAGPGPALMDCSATSYFRGE